MRSGTVIYDEDTYGESYGPEADISSEEQNGRILFLYTFTSGNTRIKSRKCLRQIKRNENVCQKYCNSKNY